jgi:3'-phosphoadenosine 5'-phosphosulfate sulfotransferase (PAPS reductase)/FAD synthetase
MNTVVSVSGGKDSQACLLLAIERGMNPVGVFCDTGNEHPLTYEHVDYLESATGVEIIRLEPDFSDWWWRRRDFVANKWAGKGVPDDAIRSALEVYDQGPTGNPYLDLCVIKNRFPSRMAQFCTQFLKRDPITEWTMDFIDEHGPVESWQGVRADESRSRAKLPEREDVGGGLSIYRPILNWTAQQVIEYSESRGIRSNPLYRMGMGRVGCMPCINCRKGELAEIAKRFPDQIDRIEQWEAVVARVSKSGSSTFFSAPGDTNTAAARGNIREKVRWATNGGQSDVLDDPDGPLCSSVYGLCE